MQKNKTKNKTKKITLIDKEYELLYTMVRRDIDINYYKIFEIRNKPLSKTDMNKDAIMIDKLYTVIRVERNILYRIEHRTSFWRGVGINSASFSTKRDSTKWKGSGGNDRTKSKTT